MPPKWFDVSNSVQKVRFLRTSNASPVHPVLASIVPKAYISIKAHVHQIAQNTTF